MSPLTFLLFLCFVCGGLAFSVFSDDSVVSFNAVSDGNGSIQIGSGSPLTFVDVVQWSSTQVDFKKSTWLNTGVLSSLKDGNLDISGTPVTVTATTGNISMVATDATKKAGLWANEVETLVASSSGMTVPLALVDTVSWTTGDLALASTAGSVQFYSQSATNKASFSLKGAAVLNVTKEQLEFQNAFTWAPAGAITAKPTVATKAVIAKNGTTTMTVNNTEIKFSSTPSAAGVADSLESATAATVLVLKGQTGVDINAVNATTGAVNITKATTGATAGQFTGEEDLILAAADAKAVKLAIAGTTLATLEKAKVSLEGTITHISGEGALTVQSGTGDLKFSTVTGSVNLQGSGVVLAELKDTSSDFKNTKFTMSGTNAMDIKGKATVTTGGVYKGGIAMGAGKTITSAAALTIGSGGDLALSGATVTLQANSVDVAKVEATGFTVQAALTTTFTKTSTFKGATSVAGTVTLVAGATVTSTGAQTISTAADKLSFDSTTAVNVSVGGVTPFDLGANQLTFQQNVIIPQTGFATFNALAKGETLSSGGVLTYAGAKISGAAGTALNVKSTAATALDLDGTSINFKVNDGQVLEVAATAVNISAKTLDISSAAAGSVIQTEIKLNADAIIDATTADPTFQTTGSGALTLGAVGTGTVSLNIGNTPVVTATSTTVTIAAPAEMKPEVGTGTLTITGDLTTDGVITTAAGGITASTFVSSAGNDLIFTGPPNGDNTFEAANEIKLVSGANSASFKSTATTITGPAIITVAEGLDISGTLNVEGVTTFVNFDDVTNDELNANTFTFNKDTTISTAGGNDLTIGDDANGGQNIAATVQQGGKVEFKSGSGTATSLLTMGGTGVGFDFLFPTGKGIIGDTGVALLGILQNRNDQGDTVNLGASDTGSNVSLASVTSVSMSGANAKSGCFCSFATPSNSNVGCSCRFNSTTIVAFAVAFNTVAIPAFTTGGINFVAIVPAA